MDRSAGDARGFPRLERRAVLAGTAVFLLGGIDAFGNGDTRLAIGNAAAALLNLLALRWAVRSPRAARLALFGVNAALAFFMAYATHAAGKVGLPYAWLAAGVFFLVVGWKKYGPEPGTT